MIKKKAKGKAESSAKKSIAKEKKNKAEEKQVDLAGVRKSIMVMVTDEFAEITQAAVDDAKKGQLATVKYLFEVAGVYPPSTDDSGVRLEDDSLARTLMDRLNIPFTPLPPREDDEERVQVPVAKVAVEDADEQNLPSENVEASAGDVG